MSDTNGGIPNGGHATRGEWARFIGDELIAFLREHEQEVHDGERCQDDAINMLAFLCHCSGIHLTPEMPDSTLEAFRAMIARTADYNAVHQEHDHG